MPNADQPYFTAPGTPYGAAPVGMPGAGGTAPTQAPSPKKGSRKEKPAQTKRLVNRNFMIAVVFALLAVVVVYAVQTGGKTVGKYVVVAKSAIPAGTPIDASLLKAVRMADSAVQTGAVTDTDPQKAIDEAVTAVKNERSQFPMTENQQLVPSQFGQPIANLGQPLGPDERLVSFQATVAASVAGSIQAGDTVDMYAAAGNLAGPLVTDVPIVSVTVSEDQYNSVANAQTNNKKITPADALPAHPVPGTYVVRVPSEDVSKIIAADSTGKIYLVYRGAGAKTANNPPTSVLDALCAGQPAIAGCSNSGS